MNEKIKSIDELSTIAAQARADGRKVVLAHGVFDILHIGHKRHLELGKRNGEFLLFTIPTAHHVNKNTGHTSHQTHTTTLTRSRSTRSPFCPVLFAIARSKPDTLRHTALCREDVRCRRAY